MRDEDEISIVYRQYITLVRTRAAELLFGDKSAAEDVAHEVFIKFMQYRAKHPIDGSPAALLYCITHRTCVDRMRKAYRHNTTVQESEVGTEGPASIDDRIAIEQAIEKMHEEEVRIGAAFYLEDLDLPGIADSMRISERTVSRRLSSFRSRLRALLEGRPPVVKEETDGV